MTPNHPRWRAFASRLYAVVTSHGHGCNGEASPAPYEACRAILSSMPGVDVDGTLDWLAARGGACDCTVGANVMGRTEAELEALERELGLDAEPD
jgi:hypothetical protein